MCRKENTENCKLDQAENSDDGVIQIEDDEQQEMESLQQKPEAQEDEEVKQAFSIWPQVNNS